MSLQLIKRNRLHAVIWEAAKAAGRRYALGFSAVSCIDYRDRMEPEGLVWTLSTEGFIAGMREATREAFGAANFACRHINSAVNDNGERAAS